MSGSARLTPVPGLDTPCQMCLVCIAEVTKYSTAARELASVGVEITAGEPNPGTHFWYPYSGAQAGNAVVACDKHAELIRAA